MTPEIQTAAAAARRLRDAMLPNQIGFKYYAELCSDRHDVLLAYLALHPADDEELIDEAWLKQIGWVAIGNTYYPPEDSLPVKYQCPLAMWVRVDGTLRLIGSEYESGNDATRGQLRRLAAALSITLKEAGA
jgi:hypothetical protein